jgi:hypothetical protein
MLSSLVWAMIALPLLVTGSNASCLPTLPSNPPFVPPDAPASPQQNLALITQSFWHGSESLWTLLPMSGTWKGLSHYSLSTKGFRQKVFWWSEGYDWRAEPKAKPSLIVTGRRLDGDSPSFAVSNATNAFNADMGSAMLVGVDIASNGCWEITGHYGGHTLSFVISVEP